MTTSKIKEVVSVKPFTNSYGTTQYHCLIMDNGDEINIGKKDLQKVGWELTYELTGGDDGQQKFKKAKAVKKDEVAPQGQQKAYSPAITAAATDPAVWRKKDIAIIYQNALTQSNSYHSIVGYDHKNKEDCLKSLLDTADIIAKFVIEKSKI